MDGDGHDAEAAGGDDCDDTDASVHPGAPEVAADGIDQDCSGADDDDLDGDGYGLATDCDDADPAINPAAAEIPLSGVDEDCDGYVDLDAGSLDDVTTYWTTDGGSCGQDCLLGYSGLAEGPDTDGDSVGDLLVGSPHTIYSLPSTLSGSTYNAGDDAVVLIAAESGSSDGGMWEALVSVQDMDADGWADLVAAHYTPTPTDEDYQTDLYLFSSSALSGAIGTGSASMRIALDGDYDSWVETDALDAADLDGDGVDELIVGDAGYSPVEAAIGCVLVLEVNPGSTVTASDADALLFTHTSGNYELGLAARAAGDVDGDGLQDVYLSDRFTGWVASGTDLTGSVDVLSEAIVSVDGLGYGEPESVTAMDVDADGLGDLLLQDRHSTTYDGADWSGAVLVYTTLTAGGARTAEDADAAIVDSTGTVGSLSNTGSLRATGADLAVTSVEGSGATWWGATFLLPAESIPTSGVLDFAARPDVLATDAAALGWASDGFLRLADVDSDDDDDILAVNSTACPGYGYCEDSYPGVLAVIENAR